MEVNLTPRMVKQVIRLEDLVMHDHGIELIFVFDGESPQLEEMDRN